MKSEKERKRKRKEARGDIKRELKSAKRRRIQRKGYMMER